MSAISTVPAVDLYITPDKLHQLHLQDPFYDKILKEVQ